MTGDQDDVRVRLGNACGDGADADFRNELHVDPGARVGILQVVDQLREVFDGVDVVVRGRGNESHARGGVTNLGDPWIDLGTGQLATFTGLRALRNLDLDFVGVDKVFAGDAEAAGSDLFDGGALAVAVRQRLEAFGIFAAFAGVRLAADAVHRDGERFVRFL